MPAVDTKIEAPPYVAKILTHEGAIAKIRALRERGRPVFLAQGVFDTIQDWHINLFNVHSNGSEANRHVLFVGVENDEAAGILKREYGLAHPLDFRIASVAKQDGVDYVFGFDDVPYYDIGCAALIRRYRGLQPTALAVSNLDPDPGLKQFQAKQSGIGITIAEFHPTELTTSQLYHYGYE